MVEEARRYFDAVQLYAVARVPGREDDAEAREVWRYVERMRETFLRVRRERRMGGQTDE